MRAVPLLQPALLRLLAVLVVLVLLVLVAVLVFLVLHTMSLQGQMLPASKRRAGRGRPRQQPEQQRLRQEQVQQAECVMRHVRASWGGLL